MQFQLLQRDGALEPTHESDIDHEPARFVRRAFRIVVPGLRVEGGVVRVALSCHLGNADNTRFPAVGVVEKDTIPQLHLIAHEVACLIVAYPIPGFGLAGTLPEMIDTEDFRFRFHEPVRHVSILFVICVKERPLWMCVNQISQKRVMVADTRNQ